MPIIRQSFISRKDLRQNPSVLYLFGDNDKRRGFGGQAKEMRGESNAIGIRTKKSPDSNPDSYWTDQEIEINRVKITEDLYLVRAHLEAGGICILPSNGIGTGLSRMQRFCPQTFQLLQRLLTELEQIK